MPAEARWLSFIKDHTWRHHEVETSALSISAFSSERCLFRCPKLIAVAVQWESRNDQTRGGSKPSARDGSEPGTAPIDKHHWFFAFQPVLIIDPFSIVLIHELVRARCGVSPFSESPAPANSESYQEPWSSSIILESAIGQFAIFTQHLM